MVINDQLIKNDERVLFSLRRLYQTYGYSRYKMSKFEEYDLYVRNKDFLVSDQIISFTDTNGRLLALKPDVTLSIIKNFRQSPGYVQKVYYNENVYRVSKGTRAFKEIMQAGLECMGDIGLYEICEVLMLALRSLSCISEKSVLDVSHLGLLAQILDESAVSEDVRSQIVSLIGEKNRHELDRLCIQENISEEIRSRLSALVSTYGSPAQVLPALEEIVPGSALEELKAICQILSENGAGDRVRIDFSIVNDMNYYGGVVFKGYVEGIPSGILSGGQYDKLMQKMGKPSRAIGFAVYLDWLERLSGAEKKYDVDTVLLHDGTVPASELFKAVQMLTDNGQNVLVEKTIPETLKYRQLLRMRERGLEIVERND